MHIKTTCKYIMHYDFKYKRQMNRVAQTFTMQKYSLYKVNNAWGLVIN